ncbi:MAG: hypothetical protein AAGF31_02635 [Planctomycetota bacterium]
MPAPPRKTTSPQTAKRSAEAVLDRDFLIIRAKLLEVAASLDRLAAATDPPADAERIAKIRQAIESLLDDGADHAETLQQIFSLPYDADWQERFGLGGSGD